MSSGLIFIRETTNPTKLCSLTKTKLNKTKNNVNMLETCCGVSAFSKYLLMVEMVGVFFLVKVVLKSLRITLNRIFTGNKIW